MKTYYDFSKPSKVPRAAMAKRLKPVHPGDILLGAFMEPHGLSSNKLAKELKVSAHTVSAIVRRRRAVTAEMALSLSHFFGTTAQLWQKLQMHYDLEMARLTIGKQIHRNIKPLRQTESGTLRAA